MLVPQVDSIRLLDVRIDRLHLSELLDRVLKAVRKREKTMVLYVNVHSMNIRRDNSVYADILERADIVYCDGVGVLLGARLAGRPLPERMTGADWIWDLCGLAVRENLSLFLLAGEPGAADEAAGILQARYPGLQIAGTLPGYDIGPQSIEQINRSRPHILLVGMGTPRQERWISDHRAELNVPVVWAVGALFDFVSGRIPRGPRWMTEHGLEWLCRLAVEPKKLWRRYLIGNPRFFWRLLTHYWLGLPG